MISEPIKAYPQDIFDFDDHIVVFLHTSAVYFDVKNSLATCQGMPSEARTAKPAIHL